LRRRSDPELTVVGGVVPSRVVVRQGDRPTRPLLQHVLLFPLHLPLRNNRPLLQLPRLRKGLLTPPRKTGSGGGVRGGGDVVLLVVLRALGVLVGDAVEVVLEETAKERKSARY
jgi:hypothetical protein